MFFLFVVLLVCYFGLGCCVISLAGRVSLLEEAMDPYDEMEEDL